MTERNYYDQRPFVFVNSDALGAKREGLGHRFAKLLRQGLNRVLPRGDP